MGAPLNIGQNMGGVFKKRYPALSANLSEKFRRLISYQLPAYQGLNWISSNWPLQKFRYGNVGMLVGRHPTSGELIGRIDVGAKWLVGYRLDLS